MKVCVPSETGDGLESIRSGHFGHAAYFTLVDIEDDKIVNVESVKNVDHDVYGCGGVISYALSLGINAIIVVGCGQPPYMRFTAGGVTVYSDTVTPKVGDVIDLFIQGKVNPMDPSKACVH